jgi:hypothetical protein
VDIRVISIKIGQRKMQDQVHRSTSLMVNLNPSRKEEGHQTQITRKIRETFNVTTVKNWVTMP